MLRRARKTLGACVDLRNARGNALLLALVLIGGSCFLAAPVGWVAFADRLAWFGLRDGMRHDGGVLLPGLADAEVGRWRVPPDDLEAVESFDAPFGGPLDPVHGLPVCLKDARVVPVAAFEVGVEPDVCDGGHHGPAGVGGFAAPFEVDVHVGGRDDDWCAGAEYDGRDASLGSSTEAISS